MSKEAETDFQLTSSHINSLQSSEPVIPDALVSSVCSSVGFVTDDVRIIRTVALATQAFMANITNGAVDYSKVRLRSGQSEQLINDSKLSLTMADLTPALKDHGIISKKAPYFV